ncbi:MAG: hypothetical protein A2381_00090 [Bdellovibrionales bacterium RIFOXYB1_FULL_37_110]|nr:MAG: hypothetical protein A2181_06100 [Bdellovibrionales bacterium RIFOXYA1_FULL_38_20]OFZ49285.1 MAG: hypothetical protein A2417_17275 [Bdellovibrionales bacterium RIFOXYC1_FULL_37_79]OFZ57746.1 MAG: hypothetical protein A2381_00090 [Bdellovibrionales bacterium RIFOXYB1_FULL_37_110]OFZ61546.1 MAG: hypothetical protein A2577_00555 [Bdellovibrionales bacterium RIFOXYD1_FULL_36_51]
MKKLSLALSCALLVSLSAFAYFEFDYDNDYNHGNGNSYNSGLRCQATDDGWEEHFGGHSSCGACLREHEDCTMRCYEDEVVATAEGRNQYGEIQTVTAMDRDSIYARERALDRCYNQRLSNCTIVDTDTNSRLVRSERCFGHNNNNNGDGYNTCSYREYYRRRPDVKASGMDALTHYNRYGKNEGMCRPVR